MSIAEKLTVIAQNEQKVYDSGYDEGVKAGRKAEYDEFWNVYIKNGVIGSGEGMFHGAGWNDETFKPNKNMAITYRADSMFKANGIMDLQGDLDRLGITIDFSKCVNFSYTFAYSTIGRIGILDVSSAKELGRTFEYCGVKTIDLLKLNNNGSQAFGATFYETNALENINIEGVIGNSVSFEHSGLLTCESLKSIITALKDFTGLSNGFSRTLTLNSQCVARLEAEGPTSPNGNTWIEYINDKKWNLVS